MLTRGFFRCIIIELENALVPKLIERLIEKCGIDVGNIVLSTAGRDKNEYFLVVKVEDNYVYLVDGNIRKVENPKKKKSINT